MRQLWLESDLHKPVLHPSADQWRRLRRVLRLRDGDSLTVADGRGARRLYVLNEDGLHAAAPRTEAPGPTRQVHIGVGVLKGERQSWLLQKLVEVGADSIAPLALKHCVVKLEATRADKRVDRWQAVAVEAFEQCGRARLPEVTNVQRLSEWLGSLPEGCALAWCDERGGARAIATWAAGTDATDVALVVGPEGGLSDEERALLVHHGATPVHLGDAVLRAETAAIVAAWAAHIAPPHHEIAMDPTLQ